MRNHPVLSFCFMLAMSVLWLIRKDLVSVPVPEEPPKAKRVELLEVQVRSFQSAKRRVIDLKGQRVVTNEKDTEMDLEPVEGTVTENGGHVIRFRADRGTKRPSKAGELLDFLGRCDAVTWDGRSIHSAEILYYPHSGQVQTPGPATVLTSDTRVTGDRFETSTRLRTGVVTGNVEIVSTWKPHSAVATAHTTRAVPVAPPPAPAAPVAPPRIQPKPPSTAQGSKGKPASRKPRQKRPPTRRTR
ncbi:MAG: hypothetical protein HY303_08175, partial [Candidatus Wallbacteria bacterium]|nr:hypothetical protein [Candidatus Wallbacteria bacterium]